jgi:predicted alpha/beta-hydrolase family hydrolase
MGTRVAPTSNTYRAERPVALLILAHGAGAGQGSPFMVRTAEGFASRGVTVVTFDFPYMAAKRKVPDAASVLERAWHDRIASVREELPGPGLPLFIGGKSMGGRIASQVAAQRLHELAGLLFLGYPLHPPGKPQQRRDAHLPLIREPMLFVQGERDAFGTADEIRELLPRLNGGASVHVIAGGDHSYRVPGRSGRTQIDVLAEVIDAAASWMREHIRRHP